MSHSKLASLAFCAVCDRESVVTIDDAPYCADCAAQEEEIAHQQGERLQVHVLSDEDRAAAYAAAMQSEVPPDLAQLSVPVRALGTLKDAESGEDREVFSVGGLLVSRTK